MDCALGVYVTKCENRIEELEAALSEQIECVKGLADGLISAGGREARLKAKLAKALYALSKLAKHDTQKIAMAALRANWLDLNARDSSLVEIAKHDTKRWSLAALSALKGETDE